MGDGGEHRDAEYALDMVSVAWKAALNREEGFAAKQDCIPQEPPIFIAQVAKLSFAETS